MGTHGHAHTLCPQTRRRTRPYTCAHTKVGTLTYACPQSQPRCHAHLPPSTGSHARSLCRLRPGPGTPGTRRKCLLCFPPGPQHHLWAPASRESQPGARQRPSFLLSPPGPQWGSPQAEVIPYPFSTLNLTEFHSPVPSALWTPGPSSSRQSLQGPLLSGCQTVSLQGVPRHTLLMPPAVLVPAHTTV